MNRILTYMLFLLVAVGAVAQVNVSGTVIDKESNEPLAGASVVVKGADGKIKKFATSKGDGSFAISLPTVAGCRLVVSMMSFAKKSIPLDSVSFPVSVQLEPGAIQLKEVAVKADRIREQGDTITYNVGGFAQTQDRSIGDVLRRMPGINVEESGKIQYQGEDINKFYIEGSDLLGGKYGVATNGINHEDIGAVEVMENHQPMQVLAGISYSDRAAINLKLKSKAKATWSVHGDAGGGYARPSGHAGNDRAIWDGELFAMAIMPGFQNITTLKTNNTGEDLSLQSRDFLFGGRETALSRYVSVKLPQVPSLDSKRTLFNRSVLFSTNFLHKLSNGELKAQLDYSFNRVTADASNITTYFLPEGERVVRENRSGVEHSHSLSAKFIYELNRKTAFINNTLTAKLDWDDMRLSVSGSLSNRQTAALPDYYVCNSFKMIKRFNGNNLITFESRNEWESLPQTLRVVSGSETMRQHVGDHAFFTRESASYVFVIGGVTLSLEGGLKAFLRKLDTDFSRQEDENHADDDGGDAPGFTNVVNTNYFTLFANPKFEYRLDRVNLSLDAPLSLSRHTFDKAIADRTDVYFAPSLSMEWKPNNRFAFGLDGSLKRSPMSPAMIHPSLIMSDYRSFSRGVDDFYNRSSRSVSADVSYKHTRKGLFANALVSQSWSHLPYTMSQLLDGDYIVSSYSSAESDSKFLLASANVGKTLDFIRGSSNLRGTFSRSESHIFSADEGAGESLVNTVTTSWGLALSVSGTPLRWLGFDYTLKYSENCLSMNGLDASWLSGMENELLINIMPARKWEWHLSGQHYRNELTEGSYKNVLLLDTKLVFKLTKRIELSASLRNILDKQSYNYTTYSRLSSFESQRHLRGRELMFSILLRK